MKSPHDATVDELISAGWGEYSRECIPHDWQTRRGPDVEVGRPKRSKKKWPTVEETNATAFRTKRRANYLKQTGKFEQLATEFCKTLVKRGPYGESRRYGPKGSLPPAAPLPSSPPQSAAQ